MIHKLTLFLSMLFVPVFVISSFALEGNVFAASEMQDSDPASQCAKGLALFFHDKPDEALPLLQNGLSRRSEGSFTSPDDLGLCALAAGTIYNNSGDFKPALDVLFIGLDSFKQSKNQMYEAATLRSMGVAYHYLGEYDQSLTYFEESLKLSRVLGNRALEGSILGDIGNLYLEQGKTALALEDLQKALVINQEIGNHEAEGRFLNDIGTVYSLQGNYRDAINSFQRALIILSAVENSRAVQSTILGNIGEALYKQGQYSQALEYFQQQLAIARALQNKLGEGSTLNSLGKVYYSQGEYTLALEYYQRALDLFTEAGIKQGENAVLNTIGAVYEAQRQQVQALEYYQRALQMAKEMGSQTDEAASLNNIGSVYEAQAQYDQALVYYQQALVIFKKVQARDNESTILSNIGKVYIAKKEYDKAVEYLESARGIAQEIGDPLMESKALDNLGHLYAAKGEISQALEYYLPAIDLVETIRAQVGEDQSRAEFISQFQYLYDGVIELLIHQNQFEKAFEISERGRARAFLDSMATGYVELSDEEAKTLYAAEQEAYRIRVLAQDSLNRANEEKPPDPVKIAALTSKLDQAKKTHQASLDSIAARKAFLEQLIPERRNFLGISQAQALLNNQTTLLSYWVLDDQILVFIITKNSFETRSLPVSRKELYQAIHTFREFANIHDPYPKASIVLFHELIEPILPELKTSDLVIVPHGELHYLPFEALSNRSEYLMDKFTISYLPSVTSWMYIKPNRESVEASPLILGAPDTNLPPLQFAEEEASTIGSLLKTSPVLGKEASETTLRRMAANASILHIAAHGSYNPNNPLYSTIYLSADQKEDGMLEVQEIYSLDLSKSQLVVLSACESQLGELSRGDELVGMSRAFFVARAPSVLASLWNVDDAATALLMESFYSHLEDGMSKADALRQAQIEIRAKYPNPYYWAAFVLTGDTGVLTEITALRPPKALEAEMSSTKSVLLFGACFILLIIATVSFIVVRRADKRALL